MYERLFIFSKYRENVHVICISYLENETCVEANGESRGLRSFSRVTHSIAVTPPSKTSRHFDARYSYELLFLSLPTLLSTTTDNPWCFAIWQSVEGERGFIRDWKYPRAYGMHYRSSRFGFRLKKEGVGAKIVLGWKGDSFYTRWTSIRVFKHIYVYIYIL